MPLFWIYYYCPPLPVDGLFNLDKINLIRKISDTLIDRIITNI